MSNKSCTQTDKENVCMYAYMCACVSMENINEKINSVYMCICI